MAVGVTLLMIAIGVTSLPRGVRGMPVRCTGNTRYVPPLGAGEWDTGTCEACPPCDGGGFMYNLSLPRKEDPIHGFTSCRLCVPCPIGQYRESGSIPVCNRCVKSCVAVNRFESQPCGGSSPGHCGECFDGYVALTHAAEGECKNKPETPTPLGSTEKSPSAGAVDKSPSEVATDKSPSGGSIDKAALEVNSKAEASVNIDGGTVVGSLAAIITVVTLTAIALAKLCGKTSQEGMGPKTGTSASENEAFIKTAPVSKMTLENSTTSLSSQVEPDAQTNVRREMPEVVSINELEALLPHAQGQRYPSCTLTPDDPFTIECITHIARNIGGESNRRDLFRALNIKPAVYEPEEEKWLKDKHSYSNYIYTVLRTWLIQNAQNEVADLSHLCSCLGQSDLSDISEALVTMYNTQATQLQHTGSTGSEHDHVESASGSS